jgi:hypothetical protein
MQRVLTWSCFLALSLGVLGCATSGSGRTSEAKSALDLQVFSPPPADKSDGERPEAPGSGYIWVAGYWDYLDGNYIWRGGHWLQANAQYEYIRASYDHDGEGWVFHRPHWKRRQTVSTVQANAK